jgi:hypothetical protein
MLALSAWNYSMLPGGGTYSTIDDILAWAIQAATTAETDPSLHATFTATTPESAGYASGWGTMGGRSQTDARSSGTSARAKIQASLDARLSFSVERQRAREHDGGGPSPLDAPGDVE